MVDEAIRLWELTGLTPAQRGLLEHAPVHLADLAPGYLGLTGGGAVWVDADAAGYGWSADPTGGDPVERNRMDLLSVVAHELGHVIGLDHDADESNVMGDTLAPGERRTPGIPPPSALPVAPAPVALTAPEGVSASTGTAAAPLAPAFADVAGLASYVSGFDLPQVPLAAAAGRQREAETWQAFDALLVMGKGSTADVVPDTASMSGEARAGRGDSSDATDTRLAE